MWSMVSAAFSPSFPTLCTDPGSLDRAATSLGALFVAQKNAYGGVDFTKLTLWA